MMADANNSQAGLCERGQALRIVGREVEVGTKQQRVNQRGLAQ